VGILERTHRETVSVLGTAEARTRQILLVLQYASQKRCGLSCSLNEAIREKRIKDLARIQDILGHRNPRGPVYDIFATILRERSKKRELWLKRELDPVFKRMHSGCQPIPFPAIFHDHIKIAASDDAHFASSAMPNEHLKELASHVEAWGICYENQSPGQLPVGDLLDSSRA